MRWKQSIVGKAAAADTSLERPKIDEEEQEEEEEEQKDKEEEKKQEGEEEKKEDKEDENEGEEENIGQLWMKYFDRLEPVHQS